MYSTEAEYVPAIHPPEAGQNSRTHYCSTGSSKQSTWEHIGSQVPEARDSTAAALLYSIFAPFGPRAQKSPAGSQGSKTFLSGSLKTGSPTS